MTALPRHPDRLATTDALDALGSRLDTRIDALGSRLDAKIDVLEANLRREITSSNSDLLRTLFFGMVGTNATLVGLVFAAVRLA